MSEITPRTLRRLMDNDPTINEVRVAPHYDSSHGVEFYTSNPDVSYIFPRGDVGWKMAGEIIGNNTTMDALRIRGRDVHHEDLVSSIERLRLFFNGAARNSSISEMTFIGWGMPGGSQYPFMMPLLEKNSNLTTLKIWGSPEGNNEGILSLASSLSRCYHRLETLSIRQCSLVDVQSFGKLLKALIPKKGKVSTLDVLDLSENNIGRGYGCCAALGLMLSMPRCRLKTLVLIDNNIEDEGLIYLADGLAKNDELVCMNIFNGNPITERGWSAIVEILCNKSCINHTYLSNHTLQDVGVGHRTRMIPHALRAYLKLNSSSSSDPLNDKQPFAPIQKILDHHHEWDMSYMIDEDFKMLPYILSWMDRAGESNKTFKGISNKMKVQNKRTLGKRRLSTIHQFIQHMPAMVAENLKMNGNCRSRTDSEVLK